MSSVEVYTSSCARIERNGDSVTLRAKDGTEMKFSVGEVYRVASVMQQMASADHAWLHVRDAILWRIHEYQEREDPEVRASSTQAHFVAAGLAAIDRMRCSDMLRGEWRESKPESWSQWPEGYGPDTFVMTVWGMQVHMPKRGPDGKRDRGFAVRVLPWKAEERGKHADLEAPIPWPDELAR